MNNRHNLLCQLSAARFAAWDLHLYLDTHPGDVKVHELIQKYRQKVSKLTEEYQCQFGPLTHESGSGAAWYKDPWPWEKFDGGVC